MTKIRELQNFNEAWPSKNKEEYFHGDTILGHEHNKAIDDCADVSIEIDENNLLDVLDLIACNCTKPSDCDGNAPPEIVCKKKLKDLCNTPNKFLRLVRGSDEQI